jgi:hypothetical protein
VGGFVALNQVGIQRREINKTLKYLGHKWPPINEDTPNNQPKRGIEAEKD